MPRLADPGDFLRQEVGLAEESVYVHRHAVLLRVWLPADDLELSTSPCEGFLQDSYIVGLGLAERLRGS